MMMLRNNFLRNSILFLGFAFFLLLSCKPVAVKAPSMDADFEKHLWKRSGSLGALSYLADPVDVSITTKDTKSFKAKISIQSGKYIFASIYLLGFELGRAEITPDSLKFINRIERKYYFGSSETIKSLTNSDLTYYQLESLILRGLFIDESMNRRKFREHIVDCNEFYCFNNSVTETATLNSFYKKDSFVNTLVEINDSVNNFFMSATLDKYDGSFNYPKDIQIDLKFQDFEAVIDLFIGKISNTKAINKAFEVNSRYSEIEI